MSGRYLFGICDEEFLMTISQANNSITTLSTYISHNQLFVGICLRQEGQSIRTEVKRNQTGFFDPEIGKGGESCFDSNYAIGYVIGCEAMSLKI
jgi:hypothetical protein